MKKLVFLTALSLLLGLIPFSTVHDAKATAHTTQATQDIWFEITYGYNGQYVMQGTIAVNGIYRTFIGGGIIVQANIGDSYSIHDIYQSAGAAGVIDNQVMFVQIN
ncbi:hypothetical protein [Chitinophaga sp. HK235]|uniref:hypothetical protein n=1 Tax=Chitinophaga sp. HK235 TaxID=2952571 RepID=UPI001BA56B4D|nr:hypothetical protein [Chitinophaga sp. HK235]